jgi:hypothetical protein
MGKTALLIGTAVLSLTAGDALASQSNLVAKATNIRPVSSASILYNQNKVKDYGYSIVSQNFDSDLMSYDSAAADDFVVPAGKIWKVTGVDVAGEYFSGNGPASSQVITFFKNGTGHPGTVIGQAQTVNCTDTAGSFACAINTVQLTGGKKGKRYWLSIVANCNSKCGEWGWIQNTITHHDPGQWENPGGGFGYGCSSWTDTSSCIANAADDFAFDLKGRSN